MFFTTKDFSDLPDFRYILTLFFEVPPNYIIIDCLQPIMFRIICCEKTSNFYPHN